MATNRLKIGFVPEHFSTPLAFAQKHFKLDAQLISFPTGTGALAGALKTQGDDGIDVAIGLTEGFIADLGKTQAAGETAKYGIAGTYVSSPLRWALSTGAKTNNQAKKNLTMESLKGSRVGVSRIGSGSYVMSYVLADQKGWLDGSKPFEIKVIGDFAALRKAVNDDDTADWFMWEHFTTKHFWDNGELRRFGEIYTPWPSWLITARSDTSNEKLVDMLEKINQGVKHYNANKEESLQYITTTMHYSREDAEEWMSTVKFQDDVKVVKDEMVDETVSALKKAGVLDEKAGGATNMVRSLS